MSALARGIFAGLFRGRDRRAQSESSVPAQPSAEELLASIEPDIRVPLLSMYWGEPQMGFDGQRHAIDSVTAIVPSQGMWLYGLCLSIKPKTSLEIGMAYGYSTLFFLAAIAKNQAGVHTSIDPFQRSMWHGIGLAHARAHSGGSDSRFRLIEDRSDRAATDLSREGATFDLIFIDGAHRFDDVLVDFYLYAPLCPIGGHIVFDDLWMKSIQTAVAFIRSNRKDFAERPTDQPNVCLFQRIGEDSRDWADFHEFAVAGSEGRVA